MTVRHYHAVCKSCRGKDRCHCAKPASKCRHCKTRKAASKKRGLCDYCYFDLSIRELYPPRRAGWAGKGEYHEPTEEELNELIAEQRRNLPDWWEQEMGVDA